MAMERNPACLQPLGSQEEHVDFSSIENEFRKDLHRYEYTGSIGTILEYRKVVFDGITVGDLMPPVKSVNEPPLTSFESKVIESRPNPKASHAVKEIQANPWSEQNHPVQAFPENEPSCCEPVFSKDDEPKRNQLNFEFSGYAQHVVSDDEEVRSTKIFPRSDSSSCDQTAYSTAHSGQSSVASSSYEKDSPSVVDSSTIPEVYTDPCIRAFLKSENITIRQDLTDDFENYTVPGHIRFRDYQRQKWEQRYNELTIVYRQTGRSSVHHNDLTKKGLARWIKRQRAQYKLRLEGKPSSMTDERVEALNHINFVWDSHNSAWEDRIFELKDFKAKHNHCNVSSSLAPDNKALVSWVKCQRRQYRLLAAGQKSNLNAKRIFQLEEIGFQFN